LPDIKNTPSLIQTKLHRPPLPVIMVHRPRLTKWLKQCQRRPLTLVSAPAGYGKSTLLSCWLSSADCPTAWVSLDEHDSKLGNFLSYFLAAIEMIFPDALPESKALLIVTPQPSITAIAHTLINELNQIEKPFILVLDDYHLIETQIVHDLLNELLIHPPPNLHLVLGTRMDPPLPLATLRANNQMTEIRIQDLRFNQEETQKLFQEMIGISIDPTNIQGINAQAEGWVTGLRLAALAMYHRIGPDPSQGELSVQNRYVTEYLFNEILTKQASSLSDGMLKTSILNRFCAELCEAICFPETTLAEDESSRPKLNGGRFLEWLQASNLFVIPLDDQNEWFRYHHLFQDFLQQELERRSDPDEILKLHTIAGHWYAENSWIEEALNHLLAANNTTDAIELIAQHRYQMMNDTQWPRLERWLSLFPAEVIEASAELWMLKTWLIYQRGQWSELPASLAYLDTLLENGSDPGLAQYLAGEVSSLRGLISYRRGDIEGTISHTRQALELTLPQLWIVRVFARMSLGVGLLLKGDVKDGYQAYYGAFDEEQIQTKQFKATLLMTACYFHWITADLHSMTQAAKQAIAFCLEVDFRQILGQSRYHLGCVRYQQNDLTAAEELFAWVVSRPYQNYGTCYVSSVCGLATTYQFLGKEMEAREVVEAAIAFLLGTGNMSFMPLILALQAEIALRQERLPVASQWAAKLDPVPPLTPMPWFLAPHLTLVKVWLAQNTSSSLMKATELLDQLQEYLTGIHNTRFLIDTLALRALLLDAAGDQVTALAALEKSLRLAQPGGFIRAFADLGPPMARLLSQLRVDRGLQTYVDEIQAAFPESQQTASAEGQNFLPEPLTSRELQILELLKRRLTNKEIAVQLMISVGTVKGHTVHIYDKLNVEGRRQAVEKAIALGILTSQ